MFPDGAITFAGARLDRADRLRGDAAAVAALLARADATAAPLWRGKALFDLTEAGPRLAWVPAADPLIAEAPAAPILLGLEPDGRPRFASDVSHIAPPDEAPAEFVDRRTLDLSETRKFIDLRSIMGDLDPDDANDAATAKGLFEWHAGHGFCARCGAASAAAQAGWRRDCPECGRQHFPRTDPVVIMLILDGDHALLGRQSFWPPRMYSLLAGFMEPGETIETAVRREVREEAGLAVGEVRYLVSQPWPFPASLMIGCAGRALEARIRREDRELEDAIWVSKDEIAEALAGRNPRIAPARKGAVAQAILTAWVEGRVGGFGRGRA